MLFDSVTAAIGHTPLVRLRIPAAPGVRAYAKLEMQNLMAMKDRVAKEVVLRAREAGTLVDGAPIVESSSGTMALGLALVGNHLGHPVHIVTDPRIDPITLTKLEALGCAVHVVEAMTGAGWQSARLERLAHLMDDLPGAFWPQQYHNPHNPLAYRALADELLKDIDGLDVLVGAVGSGGSLCGTTAALRADRPELTSVGVDAVGSMLFAQPDRPERLQSGLGNSLQPDNIDYAVLDEVHWLSDDEAFAATRALAREQQIFAGNTSGSVYRVLTHLARQAAEGTTLVGIFPDRGDRYVESVYRHRPETQPRSHPVQVPYGTVVTAWSFAELGRNHRRQLGFIEANTTGTGMTAIRTAARLDVEPVLFTSSPQRYRGLPDVRVRTVVCDTDDTAELARTIKANLSSPAGIATTSDFYLPQVSELTASFDLPGNPPEAIAVCRDKAATRRMLSAAEVRQPGYAVVAATDEIPAAIAVTGLPCVVKPIDDSGSNNVRLCHDLAETADQVECILAVTTNVRGQATARLALIEEYVAGPEVSVEMFSHDATVTCLGVTAKSTLAPPHFVEARHVFPAALPPALHAEVLTLVTRALSAAGIREGATHTEVRLGSAGPSIVEINARPAGGMIPELVRLATGVDIVEQHLRAACRLPVQLSPARDRTAGIAFLTAGRTGRLTAVEGTTAARRTPGVVDVAVTAAPGTAVRPPRNAYDRLGHVIAVGSSGHEVSEALDAALGYLRIEVNHDRTA
ncbi:pyridoxal-phosphate dependent enzyme [Micromonospora sp. NPDC049751]|uniref:pyridoxal-phosphate dependent enzyme n=1 Tax=Micromonospora sp. NPDC049751 TaxID=3154837 RepID=UPI0033C30EBB